MATLTPSKTATDRDPVPIALLAAVAGVALAVGGLLVGFEPTGGDPDCLYRPIKAELARALARGTLPFWSDRFGLGVPLVAESHAAAFYPLNWLLYRALSVAAAYRLAMWLHYVALALATFAYGRALALTPWGAALAAVAFTLCGFQASHACHEPFYHALPYLPLSLALAERFLAAGGVARLGALALALGAQLTLGHFQIPLWTCALVLTTALVRAAQARGKGCGGVRARALAVGVAVGWAGAIALPQLGLTYELTRVSRFDRPLIYLTNYSFPPAHWAQAALPGLFGGYDDGSRSAYWPTQSTTADEACFYVGTVPLVLAFVGLTARGQRGLTFWKWAAVLAFALATMPRWWPDGFKLLLRLPGLGHFRAPGRYTMLTSFGLCLLAGRGLDRTLPRTRFGLGFALAVGFGLAGLAWGWVWSDLPGVRPYLGAGARRFHLAFGLGSWLLALGAVAAWRARRLPAWGPLLLAGCELTYLYYHGSTPWRTAVAFPADSPVFRRLAREAEVGLVAGDIQDVAVSAGLTAAYPNLGIIAPPPNYLLERSLTPAGFDLKYANLLRRFGISHGVFEGPQGFRAAEVLYLGRDDALDALLPFARDTALPRVWRVERYADPFPAARVARRVHSVPGWNEQYPALLGGADPDAVLYLDADRPPDGSVPRADRAEVLSWSGLNASVAHNGACDLVIRRTHYPGWTVRVNGWPPRAVLPADGGLQAVRLDGEGISRVGFAYRPTGLGTYAACSLSGVAGAVGLVAAGLWRARRAMASLPRARGGTTGSA